MNRRGFLRNAVKGLAGLAGLVVAARLPGRSKQFVDGSSDDFIGEFVSFDGDELTPVLVSFDGDELTTGEFASFDADGFTINMSGPPLVLGDPMRKMSAPERLWLWTKKGVI